MPKLRGQNLTKASRSAGQLSNDVPLTEEEQHQLARWLGEFIPPMRIPDLLFERFGKRLSPMYAYTFQRRHKWGLLIDRYRQEWLTKVAEVPLFHQKYRLQQLQTLVERLELQHQREGVSAEAYETRLLRILEKARLEMEEKASSQTTYFFTAINQASDAELLQRRQELLKRIQSFRWPTERRLSHGMGGSEGRATPASPAA